jgi:hypothetical protein
MCLLGAGQLYKQPQSIETPKILTRKGRILRLLSMLLDFICQSRLPLNAHPNSLKLTSSFQPQCEGGLGEERQSR